MNECDLIVSAFKAQNQTASQREKETYNQGFKKNTEEDYFTFHYLKQTCLHMSRRIFKIVSDQKANL